MKLKNVLANYFEHKDLSVDVKPDFKKLEKNILAGIKPRSRKRFFPVPLVSFLGLILVLLGSYLYFNYHIEPVSAQEVLQNAENRLKEKFAYTARTTESCSTNPDDYANEFKNESGSYEDSPLTRTRIAECQKNKGELYYTRRVWVDQPNNSIRIDDSIREWDIQGFSDKKGRKRMANINPVNIKRGNDIYSFYALPEETAPDGTRPGAYVKKNANDWENEGLTQNMKAPEVVLAETIAKYKNDKKITASLSEYMESDKKYYKVSFYEKSHNRLIYEQMYEKDTYLPIKTIFYADDQTGKTFSSTATYEDFTTNVDPEIFSIANPPAGYSFIEGSINSFDISSYCETCYYGDPARYRIYPLKLTTKDGKELDIPGIGAGKIQFPINIKVYESIQRFSTKQDADTATDLKFVQLKQTSSGDTVERTLDMFYFLSNAKIGNDKPYSRLKIEVYDTTGKKKEKDIVTTAELVYSSTKLPDLGSLRFQNAEDRAEVKSAMYKWRNTDTIIEFQKPILASDLCFGYRGNSFTKTLCTIKTNDGVTEATVINEVISEKSTYKDWWRTDLTYNNIFVTIQFRTFEYDEKKCGSSSDARFKNESNPACQKHLISEEEKKQIVTDAKKLIKRLNTVWK